MTKGRWLLGALAASVALALVIINRPAQPQPPSATVTWSTVQVVRQDLTLRDSLEGTLDFGPATPLAIRASGTVTWLPMPGTVVSQGQALLRVDDRPITLMYGSVPMFRDLGGGAPTAGTGAGSTSTNLTVTAAALAVPSSASSQLGNDVAQLEANLSQLGFGGFTVDATFTEHTATAVKKWQKSVGVAQTGRIPLGDIIFAPGPLRIGGTSGVIGMPVSAESVSATALSLVVSAAPASSDVAWTTAGVAATIVTADGRRVAGVVSAGAAGQANGAGASTTPIVVTAISPADLQGLVPGRVSVERVVSERKGVLTVPVDALVALAEGGYGLHLADGPGDRFVSLTVGLFADAVVEVAGAEVHEGLAVRVPR